MSCGGKIRKLLRLLAPASERPRASKKSSIPAGSNKAAGTAILAMSPWLLSRSARFRASSRKGLGGTAAIEASVRLSQQRSLAAGLHTCCCTGIAQRHGSEGCQGLRQGEVAGHLSQQLNSTVSSFHLSSQLLRGAQAPSRPAKQQAWLLSGCSKPSHQPAIPTLFQTCQLRAAPRSSRRPSALRQLTPRLRLPTQIEALALAKGTQRQGWQ